jgi:hypothetical protein
MADEYSVRTREVWEWFEAEARRYRHEYIGTEHILLGLLHDSSGRVADVLRALGIDPNVIRTNLERISAEGPNDADMRSPLPQTPRAINAIRFAKEEASLLDRDEVEPEHLLLGLLRETDGLAAMVLITLLGADLERAWGAAQSLYGYAVDPLWLTWNDGTIVKLAQEISEGEHWDRLPILADALEEAGCTEDGILRHCRQAGAHAHHCWVLNLLLAGLQDGQPY